MCCKLKLSHTVNQWIDLHTPNISYQGALGACSWSGHCMFFNDRHKYNISVLTFHQCLMLANTTSVTLMSSWIMDLMLKWPLMLWNSSQVLQHWSGAVMVHCTHTMMLSLILFSKWSHTFTSFCLVLSSLLLCCVCSFSVFSVSSKQNLTNPSTKNSAWLQLRPSRSVYWSQDRETNFTGFSW